ncbi:MAG: nucleoid-structuring protein H-NS [Lachnospiraceae bacterium]|nr:nucleoid-structuring protein H-NS [Lachnospiraceae bacterium]
MKPEILDCTLRDGGLVNRFFFSDEFVRDLYLTNLEVGVDYMEFGYKASEKQFNWKDFGKLKFCREEDIRQVVGDHSSKMKISVMADVGRTERGSILARKDSVIDMIRIATYSSTIPEAIELIEECHEKGYETSVNIMAVSSDTESMIHKFLGEFCDSSVDVIYLVDSFGAFYPEQIRKLSNLYFEYAEKQGKLLGIHAHNNQQLAFANTLEAIHCGAGFADATCDGMGRGAGNCSMEMLVGYLKDKQLQELPILKFIEKHLIPMKEAGIRWGYELPYLLTGQGRVHPSRAIQFIQEGCKGLAGMFAQIAAGE